MRFIANVLSSINYIKNDLDVVDFWKSCFPHKDWIHITLQIVPGSCFYHDQQCKLELGICENSWATWHLAYTTHIGAVSLRSTIISKEYFLHSGNCVNSHGWTILWMWDKVIDHVEQMESASEKLKGIVFTDKEGSVNDDYNEDEDEGENVLYGLK